MVAVATALAKAPSGFSSTPVGEGEPLLGTHRTGNGNVWPQLGERSHRERGFGTRAVSTKGLAQDLADRKSEVKATRATTARLSATGYLVLRARPQGR